jgi:uncharacterized membrane-anchored protein
MTVDSNSSKNAFGVTTGSNNSCTPSLIVSSIVTPVQWLVDGIGASFGTDGGLLLATLGILLATIPRVDALFILTTLLLLIAKPLLLDLLDGKVAALPPAVAIALCVALLAVWSISALAEKKSAIGPLSITLSEPESK